MAIKKAYKAIGESKQSKMRTIGEKQTYNSMQKMERARKRLRKKTWGF